MRRALSRCVIILFSLWTACSWAGAQTSLPAETLAPAEDRTLAHEIFQQLIEINTAHSVGSVTAAAEAMRERLLAAGFAPEDLTLAGPSDRKQGLVVRYRGNGKAGPIVIMGHLDVVEAQRSDWSVDPFVFLEKDGYYYGRGTQDMKDNDAIAVETFIRLKREGYRPACDLLLMMTPDEEAGPQDGMDWLLHERPELFKGAQFAVNLDAGGLDLKDGKPASMGFEASEKTYADFELSSHDPGGHSSLPHTGNPVERIADALGRLENAPFPLEFNPVTLEFLTKTVSSAAPATQALIKAALASPQDTKALAALAGSSTYYNALLRTTCVPTMFAGGHANNALPNSATANVNCRILPGHSPAEVETYLVKALNDSAIQVQYCFSNGKCGPAPNDPGFPPVAPLPSVLHALETVTAQVFPGVPVVGEMETGYSDSIYTVRAGLPSYGISGVGVDEDDVRAHGKDERLRVPAFYGGLEFFYLFARAITASNPGQ